MSWAELAGSPMESFSESSGPAVERQLIVPSEDRLARAAFLSNALYPHFPDCRVVSMRIAPLDGSETPPVGPEVLDPLSQTADYSGKLSLITVGYGPDFTRKIWPFEKPGFREGTEIRLQTSGDGEFYKIPSSATKWDDDDETAVLESNETAILISKNEYIVQWDYVDFVPYDALEALKGRVNSDSFMGSAPETLLFMGYQTSEIFKAQPIDNHTNRISVKIRKREIGGDGGPFGWQHDYREEPAGWFRRTLKDGSPRYPETTFADMFL